MYVYACVCTCMFAYVRNMCRLGAPSGTVSIALHLTLETASLSLNLELFQIDPRPTSTGGAWLCLGYELMSPHRQASWVHSTISPNPGFWIETDMVSLWDPGCP